MTALDRFRHEFRRWVVAHNQTHGYRTDPDLLLEELEDRIPVDRLRRIGAAYRNRWLETETAPQRGYFVREADRPGVGGGQFTLIHRGNTRVDPCWELFVQLADYGWLRTIAQRHGQEVRLEDHLMDLTIRSGPRLILYVEQKETASKARRLLKEMRRYGEAGLSLTDPDRGNDALRKAKYLVRGDARPLFFGLSAIGYQQLFRVEYEAANRFRLVEDARSLSAPLRDHPAPRAGRPIEHSPIDPLALEVERLCQNNIWVSIGSGRTAFNFYTDGEHGDAIILSVDGTGMIWTDIRRLGLDRASRLSAALRDQGILLDVRRQWAFWRLGRRRLTLADAGIDPVAVAEALQKATT